MGYDISDLPKVSMVFVLAALFFVIGIVILSSFEDTQVSSVTVTDESFTMPTDEGNITLDHYRLTAITEIGNGTVVYPAANYTITSYYSSIVQLHENASKCKTGQTCYVTYTYDNYDQGTPLVIQNTMSAMSEIPNNWLILIAIILAAVIVVGIVVSNMGNYAGGRS